MDDRRSARSASRRKTPTPQPPSKPQPGRASRTRSKRSASRDLEEPTVMPKPTRRSARQASVTTMTDESDRESNAPRETKRRRAAKEPVGDLTTVEEIDSQLALDNAPGTPPSRPDHLTQFRSPGAASEMSGTTAISSFSMVEAEFLEPRFILKHLRKLCTSADEFLELIAPPTKRGVDMRQTDMHNMNDIHQPDSDFSKDYRDFDSELNVHLTHFKNEIHNYIHIRVVHRALFGSNGDVAAAQSGLDLILYLTNLLLFSKQMIHSDRTEKSMWDLLRQLDNSFPEPFLRSLGIHDHSVPSGGSALVDATYDLALDLRTQLAILILQRSYDEDKLNSDELITDVFFRQASLQEPTQDEESHTLRGWSVSLEEGHQTGLPPKITNRVVNRVQEIRSYFPSDETSSTQSDTARLEDLASNFPWIATVMRVLHWTRLRHEELQAAIEDVGGAASIARKVNEAMEQIETPVEQARRTSVARDSPRKRRTSFGQDRRRSSRKFDPNAPVDLRLMDMLKVKERDSGVHFEPSSVPHDQERHATQPEPTLEQIPSDPPVIENDEDEWQPVPGDELPELDAPEAEEQQIDEVEEQPEEQIEEQIEEPAPSVPPTSTADLLKVLKSAPKPQKENRPVSIFDRQTGAQRVEFGDGFDETQPTPGPSNRAKGKQPVIVSPQKRPRPIDLSDSEDDAFETEQRGARVQEQRRKAPVAKKVRIDPSSSGAPPSHQPPPRRTQDSDQGPVPEESVSEGDAPEMTEEPAEEQPPASSYQAQRKLALENSAVANAANVRSDRKPRTEWTMAEEEAFVEYMSIYPAKYAAILQYDMAEGEKLLEGRTQVNLKDKARTMAVNMIKSGTGLRAGFEGIVQPGSKIGRKLIEAKFEW